MRIRLFDNGFKLETTWSRHDKYAEAIDDLGSVQGRTGSRAHIRIRCFYRLRNSRREKDFLEQIKWWGDESDCSLQLL